jgi:hypothetical protein
MEPYQELRTNCDGPYVYEPLPSNEHFRYLALEPGSGDELLRCSLHTCEIGKATFEALSYVWGSETRNRRIYCDGYTIDITENLCEALQRLRNPTDVRELWADSICINQENLEEKSQQVAIMGQIYSRASRVLIYLGPDPAGHGPKVAALLTDVGGFLQDEMTKMEQVDWNAFPSWQYYANHPLLKDERWRSVRGLLEQQWFERGWVVREAGLARQGLIVWGNSRISWQTFMRTATWIWGKLESLPGLPMGYVYRRLCGHMEAYMDRHNSTLRVLISQSNWTPSTLLDYLGAGRSLHFKDRRDNIYAFLDLAVKPTVGFRTSPDYTKPQDEVFKMFAIQYLSATGDQTMLSYVVHDTKSLQSKLPTWVPRWNALEPGLNDEFCHAFTVRSRKAEIPMKLEVHYESFLKIRGTPLDAVGFASQTLYESATTPELILQLWQKVQVALPRWKTAVSNRFYEFVETLSWDGFINLDEKELQHYMEAYAQGLNSDEVVSLEDFNYVQPFIASRSNAKRFMITESGSFGLVPAIAQEGDIIVRLYGSRSLPKDLVYLLRATEKSFQYRFIGPAYLHYNNRTPNDEYAEQAETTHRHCDDAGESIAAEQDIYLC